MEDVIHSPSTDAQSLDTTYTALRTDHSRAVVDVLSERDGSTSLRELARTIAGRGSDDDSTDRPADVAAILHHRDLPKLDDAGIVDYDVGTNVVTPVRAEAFADAIRSVGDGR